MLYLIPRPLHRLALRVAHRVRTRYRRIFKPRLAGVSVIARDAEGRILLVRHSYGSGRWSVPGGGCGRGEEPMAAARREMREELKVTLANLERIAAFEEVLSGAPHTANVFAARLIGVPVPDGREVVAARFFACEALPDDLSALNRARIAVWCDRGAGA